MKSNADEFDQEGLYRFLADEDSTADNMILKWTKKVRKALDVSINLVSLVELLYKQAWVVDEQG